MTDAHKEELHVALLAPDASAPVTWKVWKVQNERQLARGRVQCQVIAPALVPRKAVERIKTDRRAARKLAELHRAGPLTEVRPPTPAEEAVRDLCRARDDARRSAAVPVPTYSGNCCFAEGCTSRDARGPRRTGAGSMV